MPLVRGDPDDPPEQPRGRIRNTRKLLTTAALIMSGFLITSSFATTVLIPHRQFEEGGQASGRALAYLAHEYLGSGFGTAYDLSTIGILWFAGASAMAVTLSVRRRGRRPAVLAFGLITLVFAYTTVANIIERPDGVKIASFFIAAILATSLISRVTRATELRVTEVILDQTARQFVKEAAAESELRIIANEPNARDILEYIEKEHEERQRHQIPPDDPVLFLEVTVADPSEFEAQLQVTGEERHGYRILRIESSAVPNAIAAVLLYIRDLTGKRPHIYFDWTEGNPVAHLVRFLIFGSGEVAPVTREVLREAEPDLDQRPFVHVV
jgi:hypothetical protein